MLDKRGKILFVDDDVQILSGIRRNLRNFYDFDTADSGELALEKINAGANYAVIVSDMRMAGMNGNQLFAEVQRISPDTICIMFTGYADLDTTLNAVNNNIFRILTKPCSSETIKEAVNDGLQQYRHKQGISSYTYTIDVDSTGKIIAAKRSLGCYSVTGYKPHDFEVDRKLRMKMVLPSYRKSHIEHFEALISGQERGPIEFQIETKDGKIKWLRDTVIPHKDSSGKVVRCEGLVEDITTYKDMSKTLQQSQARYKRMTANIPGVVFHAACDYDKKVIEMQYLSGSSSELFTLDSLSLMGPVEKMQKIFDIKNLHSFKNALFDSVREGKPCNWQGQGVIKGRKRWFQVMARPEQVSKGQYIFDGLILDITVRKRNELELQRVNKELKEFNKLKSELISTVSHELRTPMFILKNIASNAIAGVFGRINKRLRMNLEIVDQTIDRLAKIVSDFLDCSKIEEGRLRLQTETMPIQGVVKEVSESFKSIAGEKELEIRTLLPDEDLKVEIDRDRMIQVLVNLIGNAVKFSDKPGVINVFVNDHINEVEVAVQDNGPGISEEDLQKVFEKFVQVEKVIEKGKTGIGLGLHIAKELIELHDGRIWVDSKCGQGSCFSFAIPKASETGIKITEIDSKVSEGV